MTISVLISSPRTTNTSFDSSRAFSSRHFFGVMSPHPTTGRLPLMFSTTNLSRMRFVIIFIGSLKTTGSIYRR
ncbi:hypothetical protein LINGRAHAP2_LOCUS34269 [Linum grandiflorum]